MPKILVVGDIILDKMSVVESTGRVSTEAPIPIFKPRSMPEYRLGGAAATAAMCTKLGAETHFISAVTGSPYEKNCEPDHVALARLIAESGIHMHPHYAKRDVLTLKHRYIAAMPAGFDQVFRVDRDKHVEISTNEALACRASLGLIHPDVVIISDYGKGFLTHGSLVEILIAKCNQLHIPVLVDPHQTTMYERYKNATFMVPNSIEARGYIAYDIAKEYGLEGCILKKGENGCEVYSKKTGVCLLPARTPTRYVDPLGAGDQFIATLAVAAVNLEFDWLAAAMNANVAASLQTETVGVQPVPPAVIRHEFPLYCSTLGENCKDHQKIGV